MTIYLKCISVSENNVTLLTFWLTSYELMKENVSDVMTSTFWKQFNQSKLNKLQ